MPARKVVVIEDENDILNVIEYNLEREGFQVFGVRNGEEGLACIRNVNPDLVLLDLMLPGRNGLEICRAVREDPLTRHVPVIMVTAKGEESDVVLGLGLGADDYIVKPFGVKELIARIQAVMRRAALGMEDRGETPIVRGPLEIDPLRHNVHLNDTRLDFTPTEFRLLMTLAAHPGRVFTRDQLLNRAVSPDAAVVDRNIDVHIRAIRKRLADGGAFIETVRGIGYRFTEAYS